MVSDQSKLLPDVIRLAREAGNIILEHYQNRDYDEFIKKDDTPVTSADLASHQFLNEHLSKLTPDIPVLSEEAANINLETRAQWPQYWLIDPLDGTQEFIARSGDFATVIALIENNQPVMGVVYAPVSGVVYYAQQGQGAWKIPALGADPVAIHTHHHELPPHSITLAMSRRQDINRITRKLNDHWDYDLLPLGSAALKACIVAEGTADCYLRLGPTGEWDTAATQCIVEEAGGTIISTKLEALSYNERPTLINPNFIVIGNPALPWDTILKSE